MLDFLIIKKKNIFIESFVFVFLIISFMRTY